MPGSSVAATVFVGLSAGGTPGIPGDIPATMGPVASTNVPLKIGRKRSWSGSRMPSKAFTIVVAALLVVGGGGIGGWYLSRAGAKSISNTPRSNGSGTGSRVRSGPNTSRSSTHTPSATTMPGIHLSKAQLQNIAQSANLVLGDFPSAWRVCASACNSSAGGSSQAQSKQISSQLAACLGVSTQRLNNAFGGGLSGHPPGYIYTGSPTFTTGPAGNGMVFASSSVEIAPTDADVQSDLSIIEKPGAPACFQQAFLKVAQDSAGSHSGTITAPYPAYAPPIPPEAGIHGIELVVPIYVTIQANGVATVVPFYTQIAFIAMGSFEAAVMTQTPDVQVPYFDQLATVVEQGVVAAAHDMATGHVPSISTPSGPSSGRNILS
ncbi:MAG: hypothetical protein M1399_08850 [Actinobacteria bacterium]|nr:hypothetical protein [Actinomycetota bacterium]MCL5446903.1 hypothetical protein [Actinomycetota bacterium]